METLVKSPVMLYTEQTPNPETLKFVLNRIIFKGIADFKNADLAYTWSPFAYALFEFPFVKGVYLCNNFVTITKEAHTEWNEIMLELKEYIKSYITDSKPILLEGYQEHLDLLEKLLWIIQFMMLSTQDLEKLFLSYAKNLPIISKPSSNPN